MLTPNDEAAVQSPPGLISTEAAVRTPCYVVHKLAPPSGRHRRFTFHIRIDGSGRMQESTAEIDQQVADAVVELKALKASVTDVEVQIEAVTGIPRNKEAFREAVVRPRRCQLTPKPWTRTGRSSCTGAACTHAWKVACRCTGGV